MPGFVKSLLQSSTAGIEQARSACQKEEIEKKDAGSITAGLFYA